jgi:DNA-binding MarR family transcriptional regulator
MQESETTWSFVTNHARVLMHIMQEPHARLRDIAREVDITERAAQRIVSELDEAGFLSRERVGRRNIYTVHSDQKMQGLRPEVTTVGEAFGSLHMAEVAA